MFRPLPLCQRGCAAMVLFLLLTGTVIAQPLALVHDRTSNSQHLAITDSTGTLTLIGAGISDCCGMAGALAARNNNTVFVVGTALAGSVQQLHLLDSDSGDPLLPGIDLDTNIAVLALDWDDTNNRLLALTRNSTGNDLQLQSVDTVSAAMTPIGSGITNCCAVAVGAAVLDSDNQVWHVVGNDVAATQWQLLSVDVVSGALTQPPVVLSQPPVQLFLEPALQAIYHDATLPGLRLAELNPVDGTYSNIGAGISACCFAAQGVVALVDDSILQLSRPDVSSPWSFFSVDPATGTFTQQLPLAANLAVNALLADLNAPQIAQGGSVTVLMDEDATPTSFALTLDATDPKMGGLSWSVASPAGNGVASVTSGTGLSQIINYVPNADVNGTDSFVIEVTDSKGDSDSIVVNAAITAVNDAPAFVIGPDISINKDTGPQTINGWVTGISPGPADEVGQVVQFTVLNDNPALFNVPPSVAIDGSLSFTTATDVSGSAILTVQAIDDGGTANGGIDSSPTQTAVVNIAAVNDPPFFTTGPNQTVLEDAGTQTVIGWASGINPGAPDEGGQILTFVTSSDNPGLFSLTPVIDAATGTLMYATAIDAVGTATVDVTLLDDGGTANGGNDSSATAQFMIDVTAVNDAPSFVVGPNVSVLDNAGAQLVDPWASTISAGPGDEAGQTLQFNVVGNSNPAIFTVPPVIAPDGSLSFTPTIGADASSSIDLVLMDDGGTADGGADTSPVSSFTITVGPPRADLALLLSTDASGPISVPAGFTLTMDLSNAGPQDANNVLTTLSINGPAQFVASAGGCATLAGNQLLWNLSSLANGAATSCAVMFTATAVGSINFSATTISDEEDPQPANNTDITLLQPIQVVPIEVPVLQHWTWLLLLMGSVLLIGFRKVTTSTH